MSQGFANPPQSGGSGGSFSGNADALNTQSAPVDVSGALAPLPGQVLTAVDSTHAIWSNPPTGNSAGPTGFGYYSIVQTDAGGTSETASYVDTDGSGFDKEFSFGTWTTGNSTGANLIYTIYGTSANDIWAAGLHNVSGGGTKLFHKDASGWVEVADPTGGGPYLDVLWGSSSSNFWAGTHTDGVNVTTQKIFKFDGTNWNLFQSLPAFNIAAITGTGPNDVRAATFTPSSGSTIYKINGASFVSEFVFGTQQFVRDLFAVGTDVWASIHEQVPPSNSNLGKMYRNTGSGWVLQFTFPVPEVPGPIWGFSKDDVWVGMSGGSNSFYHWDGSTWTPVVVDGNPAITSIFGVTPSNIRASYSSSTTGRGYLKYNGTNWTYEEQHISDSYGIADIWGIATGVPSGGSGGSGSFYVSSSNTPGSESVDGGDTVNFLAGSGMTITRSGLNLTFGATSNSVADATSVGTGAPVFKQKSGSVLQFKNLKATGAGLSISDDGFDITINSTGGGGSGTIDVMESDGSPDFPTASVLKFDQTYFNLTSSGGQPLVSFNPGSVSGGGGGSNTLHIKETDGTPDFPSASILQFDSQYFTISASSPPTVTFNPSSISSGGNVLDIRESDNSPTFPTASQLRFDSTYFTLTNVNGNPQVTFNPGAVSGGGGDFLGPANANGGASPASHTAGQNLNMNGQNVANVFQVVSAYANPSTNRLFFDTSGQSVGLTALDSTFMSTGPANANFIRFRITGGVSGNHLLEAFAPLDMNGNDIRDISYLKSNVSPTQNYIRLGDPNSDGLGNIYNAGGNGHTFAVFNSIRAHMYDLYTIFYQPVQFKYAGGSSQTEPGQTNAVAVFLEVGNRLAIKTSTGVVKYLAYVSDPSSGSLYTGSVS